MERMPTPTSTVRMPSFESMGPTVEPHALIGSSKNVSMYESMI